MYFKYMYILKFSATFCCGRGLSDLAIHPTTPVMTSEWSLSFEFPLAINLCGNYYIRQVVYVVYVFTFWLNELAISATN